MFLLARVLRPFFLVILASILPALGCAGPHAGPSRSEPLLEVAADRSGPGEPTGFTVTTLVQWLDEPWGLDFLPDGRILLTEKEGRIKLVTPGNWETVDLKGIPAVANEGQGGLLDVLVHPDFERNALVYISYSIATDGGFTTRVARGRLRDTTLEDLEVLFTAEPAFPQRRHFGSRLLLDEGYLYITVGDRGNRDLAQNLDTHNGKVIRLLEDGRVPTDNPFVGRAGALPEIYTYGHRNQQGITRHPVDGSIWTGEHGPQGGDEVNVLRPGANYGWPIITYGEEYGGGKIGEGTHKEGMEQPLVYYTPAIGMGGIDFYTSGRYPGWKPSLLIAGLRLTRINRLELDGAGLGRETRLLGDLNMRIRDVQVGPDGLVYALADRSRLIRLDPK
jgi:glucose/arabinose dehydrogenase